MPTRSQSQDSLDWEEFKDFSGGLWQTGDDRECPRNGLLALKDAFPLRTGGLRAWGTWQAVDMTNIPNDGYIFGIFHVPGPATGTGTLGGLYVHVLHVNAGGAGSHSFKLFKHSGTLPGGQWDLLKTVAGLTEFLPAQHMTPFRMSSGGVFTFRDFYNISLNATASRGIYKTDGTTAATANVRAYDANIASALLPHQGRLLDAEMENFIQNQIRYTSVASGLTPTTDQFIIPMGEISSPITWMSPVEPSDLLVHKQEVGLLLLQGDITSPIVRQMNFQHSNTRTYPVQTDEGLVMSVGSDSVYIWTGGQLMDIAPQLLANPTSADRHAQIDGVTQGGEPGFTVPGDTYEFQGRMAASEIFLFSGKNYLMDLRTKAWFQVTTPVRATSGTETYYCVDRFNHLVFHARSLSMQAGRQLIWMEDIREDSMTRASTYTFTLPLIYRDHAFTQLRAIEFYVHTFAGTSSIQVAIDAVALDGSTTTTTLASSALPANANNYEVRFDLPGKSSHAYKIDVTMTAAAGEAPMLEKILVGTAPSVALKQL